MAGREWTIRELARADQLTRENKSLAEVAAGLGRTPASVALMRHRRRQAGEAAPVTVNHEPWTEEELALADKLIRAGGRIPEVARVLGRTPEALKAQRYRQRMRGQPVPVAWHRRRPPKRGARGYDLDDTGEL